MTLPILLFYGFAFLGLVHSILFSAVAYKNKKIDDLIITLFLFIQSIIILEYVFFWTGLYIRYSYLNNISLPLLLLLYTSETPLLQLLNMEIISVEIIRTIVGSIGLVILVPCATLISVFLIRKNDSEHASHTHHH